jgi:PPOX class probable F420-dependent enzyme
VGVLATESPDGAPRQSLVYFVLRGEQLLISTLRDRLKARDVERTGRASLCAMGHESPYPSVTLSGTARILTDGIGPATAAVAQQITGASEPPEPMSDAVLADAGRVILEITIERVTAASYIPQASEDEG